jgi:hypothetical protein
VLTLKIKEFSARKYPAKHSPKTTEVAKCVAITALLLKIQKALLLFKTLRTIQEMT